MSEAIFFSKMNGVFLSLFEKCQLRFFLGKINRTNGKKKKIFFFFLGKSRSFFEKASPVGPWDFQKIFKILN
jgi:hypothetical protein